MDTFDAIKGRRSIRSYKETPVPEDLLNKVLEAARWAPSWANTQCVRYIIVRDAATKRILSGVISKGNPSTEAIIKAPVVIVACAVLHKSGYYHGEAVTENGDWYMFDTGLAMQNLVLAAHALGLDTVHVGYIIDMNKVREILEIPQGIAVVEIVPIGYREDDTPVTPRKELAEIVSYEKYGQKYEIAGS